ncbi:MAG: hypothetical protein WC872_01050 [Candidatus Absconditabacterales bacterium]
MLKQILLGLLIAGIGGGLIYFSSYLSEMFGRIPWAENNLGGTRNGYIIFGFGIIIIGFLILFGVISTSSPMTNVGDILNS